MNEKDPHTKPDKLPGWGGEHVRPYNLVTKSNHTR